MLRDAVPAQGGTTNWEDIALLVPSRTYKQCRKRWHASLVSKIDPTTARTGKWEEDEDKKLRDAVRTHGGKDWVVIAAQVPGRTKEQCRRRWRDVLVFVPTSIVEATTENTQHETTAALPPPYAAPVTAADHADDLGRNSREGPKLN
jgi:hypothetical protein